MDRHLPVMATGRPTPAGDLTLTRRARAESAGSSASATPYPRPLLPGDELQTRRPRRRLAPAVAARPGPSRLIVLRRALHGETAKHLEPSKIVVVPDLGRGARWPTLPRRRCSSTAGALPRPHSGQLHQLHGRGEGAVRRDLHVVGTRSRSSRRSAIRDRICPDRHLARSWPSKPGARTGVLAGHLHRPRDVQRSAG